MKTYFRSKSEETTLSKEENVFWKSAMDCGFYNKKTQGAFLEKKTQGLWVKIQLIVRAFLQIYKWKGMF